MFRAFSRSIIQFLTDPRLWRILVASAFVSLLCFAVLWWAVAWLVGWAADHWEKYASWLHYGQGVAGFITALLLFPALFVFVASFFQEAVADAVEARHYPLLPRVAGAPLRSAVMAGIKFFLLLVLVNALALPFYLLLLWLMGSGALLALAVNGLLTGREYYEVVALRRLPRREMDTLRRQNRLTLFLAGTAIAALALVPVVNLFVPVLGIAVMVHLFHSRVAGPPAGIRPAGPPPIP